MEPESSLPSSQKPAICPYVELDQSSPTSLTSPLILHSQLRLGFPSGLPPTGLPTKTCMHLSYLPNVLITKRERVYCTVRAEYL